jgi:hypothetical protein
MEKPAAPLFSPVVERPSADAAADEQGENWSAVTSLVSKPAATSSLPPTEEKKKVETGKKKCAPSAFLPPTHFDDESAVADNDQFFH